MRGAALGVAVAGTAVLVWLATPLTWDGLVEPGAGGPVGGMLFLVILFGTLAGVVAGLLGRRRLRAGRPSEGRGPSLGFLAVSLVALWPFGLFVARFSQSDHEPFGSSRVFETCAAWLVYVAFAYELHRVISGRAARETRAVATSEPER